MNSRNGQEVTARRARGLVGNSKRGSLGEVREFRSPAVKPTAATEVPIKNLRREKPFIDRSPIPRRSELIPAGQVTLDCCSTPANLRAEAHYGFQHVVPAWKDRKRVQLWLRGTYRAYTDYDRAMVGVIWVR